MARACRDAPVPNAPAAALQCARGANGHIASVEAFPDAVPDGRRLREACEMTTLMFAVKTVRGGLFQASESCCDVGGDPVEPAVARAPDAPACRSRRVRMLGTYRRARVRGI